jgi:cytochrome c556
MRKGILAATLMALGGLILAEESELNANMKNLDAAVKWSEAGKAAALQLATATNSADAERVAAAMQSLAGTCRSCHEAHREKLPNGSYRIKL